MRIRSGDVELREFEPALTGVLYEVRNHPSVREHLRSTQAISRADHERWVHENLVRESERDTDGGVEILIPLPQRLGDKVVVAEGLRKGYGDKLLFDNLTFSLPPVSARLAPLRNSGSPWTTSCASRRWDRSRCCTSPIFTPSFGRSGIASRRRTSGLAKPPASRRIWSDAICWMRSVWHPVRPKRMRWRRSTSKPWREAMAGSVASTAWRAS